MYQIHKKNRVPMSISPSSSYDNKLIDPKKFLKYYSFVKSTDVNLDITNHSL